MISSWIVDEDPRVKEFMMDFEASMCKVIIVL
jgi:hypothetical protein